MGKLRSVGSLVAAIAGCVLIASCGSGKPTTIANEILPTGIDITPSPSVELELGNTQMFSATPTGHTFSFQSSNPAVLTIGANGNACAGTWNSLSNPQICNPGQPGIATVTATTLGVASTPVTVYVHAAITSIAVSKVPGQTPTISNSCLSKGAAHGPESWLYQASAFSGTTDITASVGPFSWQQITPATSTDIVNLGTPASGSQGCLLSPGGQCLNQQTATANIPGVGTIFATAGGVSSQPVSIETCRVQSISVAAQGTPPSVTSFLVSSGATPPTVNATVVDSAGQDISGVPITWSTGNPVSVKPASVTTTASNTDAFGSTNTISTPAQGVGAVTISCTPPGCNGGITPTLPIYAQAAFSFNVQPSSTATPANPTIYATTRACTDPIANPSFATCTAQVVPITRTSSAAIFLAGTPVPLPSSPDSFVYDNAGTNAYLGVDSSRFTQQGLMVFSGSTPSSATGASGKVLAVSPDQSSVILSNTADSPNQVFICSNCSASTRTIPPPFVITGATSAAFSPDSMKAYIVAGNNIYVSSKLDPLKTIPLSPGMRANDVVFHPQGNFAYVAGPSPGVTPYRSCDDSLVAGADVPTPNAALMLRLVGDGSTLLALDPPDITVISTTLPAVSPVLCTGTITSTSTSFNLGQGSFTPTQFLVAPNASTAYILGETSAGPPPARLPFIIAFNLVTQTPSLISLSNSATPLSVTVSPDSTLLFVGASDGTVHVIDAASGQDTQQVTFIFPTNALCVGSGTPATQVPLSQVRILAAAVNGSNITYSYTPVSGPALSVGQSITISAMANGGNNGMFTIAALGSDTAGNPTFAVANPNGVSALGQSGLGVVPISCNPDLVTAKP